MTLPAQRLKKAGNKMVPQTVRIGQITYGTPFFLRIAKAKGTETQAREVSKGEIRHGRSQRAIRMISKQGGIEPVDK
jgi:hypothetical protein